MNYTQDALRNIVTEMTKDALANNATEIVRSVDGDFNEADTNKLRSAVWHVNKKFCGAHADFTLDTKSDADKDLFAAMLADENTEHELKFKLVLDAKLIAALKPDDNEDNN